MSGIAGLAVLNCLVARHTFHPGISGDLMKLAKDLPGLTGLRGVLSLCVMLSHYSIFDLLGVSFLTRTHSGAVFVFFCLSAFTLLHVYGDRDFRWSDYAVARVVRIYPTFLLTLAAVSPLMIRKYQPEWGELPRDFAQQLFLIMCWPLIGDNVSWNIPTWSLSVEWLLYFTIIPAAIAVFPLLMKRVSPLRSVAISCVLAALGWWFAFMFFDWRILQIHYPASSVAMQVAPTVSAMLGAASGVFAYLYFRTNALPKYLPALNCSAVIAILGYCAAQGFSGSVFSITAPLLLLCAATPGNAIATVLSSRLAIWLGHVSYALYLVHIPALLYAAHYFSRDADFRSTFKLAGVVPLALASLVLSHIISFHFEPACRSAAARIWNRKSKPRLLASQNE